MPQMFRPPGPEMPPKCNRRSKNRTVYCKIGHFCNRRYILETVNRTLAWAKTSKSVHRPRRLGIGKPADTGDLVDVGAEPEANLSHKLRPFFR